MQYPDLSQYPVIAVDTETCDKGLGSGVGPGWNRNLGYIVGVSISWPDGSIYLPLAHPGGGNLDKATVVAYLNEQLGHTNQIKVFCNQNYDWGWLSTIGVTVRGRCEDVQVIEPLLDAHRSSYSLDSLGERYLGSHKDDQGMYDWCVKEGLKIKKNGDVREHIWRMPAAVVAPYAKKDTDLTLGVWERQKPLIREFNLEEIFDVETRLTPVLFDMMKRGVPVDLDATDRARVTVQKELDEVKAAIKHHCGKEVNYNPSGSLFDAYREMGYNIGKSEETGNDSLAAKILETNTDKLSPLILRARQLSKVAGTFLDGYILDKHHKGRVYASIKQLKGDDGGTIARLAYREPNLQNIPARDKFLGPLMRGLFLPEDGCLWGSADYKEAEPRLTAHYARLRGHRGSQAAVDYYNTAEDPSFHTFVAGLTGLPRSAAKAINLGRAYGMGLDKLCASLQCTRQRGQDILDQYEKRMPYIKSLSKEIMDVAQKRGYIRTFMGRRMRFPKFEPDTGYDEWKRRKEQNLKVQPVFYEEALARSRNPDEKLWFGYPLKRAFTYAAMNNLIQGSSADQIKLAMVQCHDAGLRPHLQVHDELDDAAIQSPKDMELYKEIMENAIQLSVPCAVDIETGTSWGNSKYGS